MKKTLPIIVIVTIAVLAIAGWLVLGKSKKAPSPAQTGQPTSGTGQQTSTQQGQSFTGKLKDALTLGTSMKCEWKTDEKHFGTTWIKNKNMYNEVSSAGKMAYTIIKDNCLWSWSEENNQGVKMCYEPEEGNILDTSKDQGQGSPPSDIDYHCQPDILADTKLNPPANINFMDISQMQGIGQ